MENKNTRTVYLAAGCFWGTEHLFSHMKGVIETTAGYANGTCEADADYKTICRGETGFRETVKVTFDPSVVSIDRILFAYFAVIDPGQRNRQGNDIGTQYQSGIYWEDEETAEDAERIASIVRARSKRFFTELKPLENFFPAEEYHQDYLDKNPTGYCHISFREMHEQQDTVIDPGLYARPEEDEIKGKLTKEEWNVTQESGTERPFSNRYWNTREKGIYVDVVTGEPLFSSTDKYESGCGWPAFTKPIEMAAVVEKEDLSHSMIRTEVRSRAGNSHLGHVFEGDPESPNGVRYCINSASLRFIPLSSMEEEGYGYLLSLVK